MDVQHAADVACVQLLYAMICSRAACRQYRMSQLDISPVDGDESSAHVHSLDTTPREVELNGAGCRRGSHPESHLLTQQLFKKRYQETRAPKYRSTGMPSYK